MELALVLDVVGSEVPLEDGLNPADSLSRPLGGELGLSLKRERAKFSGFRLINFWVAAAPSLSRKLISVKLSPTLRAICEEPKTIIIIVVVRASALN